MTITTNKTHYCERDHSDHCVINHVPLQFLFLTNPVRNIVLFTYWAHIYTKVPIKCDAQVIGPVHPVGFPNAYLHLGFIHVWTGCLLLYHCY